ncbi:hypothetical protein EON80_02570, partial [bacterium]
MSPQRKPRKTRFPCCDTTAPSNCPGAISKRGAVVSQQGNRVFRGFRWGLIPAWWSEEQRQKQRLFAARAENLTRHPSFNRALKGKRAV